MTLGKSNEKCNWNIFIVSVSVLEDLNNCMKNLFIIPQNEILGTPLVHLCSRAFLHVPAFLFEGSPKYCDEYVCLSVCLSARISPEQHWRSLPFFVRAACVCGSVLLRHVDDRPHRVSPGMGFLPH